MAQLVSRRDPWTGGYKNVYIGNDGQEYQSLKSAQMADKAYAAALKGATGTSGTSAFGGTAIAGTATGGGTSGVSTSEFLKKWGEISDASLKTLQNAVAGIEAIGTAGIEGVGDAGLSDTIKMLQEQATQYGQRYGGLETEAIEATRQSIRDKIGLQRDILAGAQPEYAGVTGRAATDVKRQSELGRAEMAREAMSLGIDPTSGKFGALTRKSFMDEAKNTAIAMNLARQGEKTRALGEAKEAMSLISPTEYSNIASGISTGQEGYYQNIGNLQSTAGQLGVAKAQALGQLGVAKSQALGGLSAGMADIGRDYGSAGLAMYGLEQGYGSNTSSPFSSSKKEYSTPSAEELTRKAKKRALA